MAVIKPKQKASDVADKTDAELTQQPVAVYYRQSTLAQIGNVSTSIQRIDMVAELVRRGWNEEDIILIDDDEGVSGSKPIDQRPGMTYLFELINDGKIGSVACQDEDRLFRDWTQIQVNIFIDACRKSNVQIITPSFTYNFSHSLYGDFHARQFRFKCDMAAEYIKSYILGRLTPAKQRILNEGKWAGSKIPVGFMADMRQKLPDGTENPLHRKFVPFEPYAAIVREHFRLFLECGGVLRKTMRLLRQRRISFPDTKPPEGFRANYKLKWREHGYYLNRGSVMGLLTNPVYIGHWCTGGEIVQWNNHEPIVDVDDFMQAFNTLSKISLTGEDNPDYSPTFQFDYSAHEDRPEEYPLLVDLLHTEVAGKPCCAYARYDKRRRCYLYWMYSSDAFGVNVEWVRTVSWLDNAIVYHLKQKLAATFEADVWTKTLQEADQIQERQKKVKRLQLASLQEDMQNVVASLATLTHPHLVQEVEQRYVQMEQEVARLEKELAELDFSQYQQVSVEQAHKLFEEALSGWDELTPDEQRNILRLCISRIVASDYDRSGKLRLVIEWRDGSTEELRLLPKSKNDFWTYDDVMTLLALVDGGASQLEIGKAFPTLRWYQIWNAIKKYRGVVEFTPIYYGKKTTYEEFQKKGGGKGRSTALPWRDHEIEVLVDMIRGGSTQLEIMKQFPIRRWRHIREKVKQVCGKDTVFPKCEVSQSLNHIEYAEQSNTDFDDACSL